MGDDAAIETGNSGENLKRQIFGNSGLSAVAQESKWASTDRPLEMMLDLTGKQPDWFRNKDVLNAGSGTSHWGLDLTARFGVIARRFENLDIGHMRQNLARRVLGTIALGEKVGDITGRLPYKDDSFDLIWDSIAPENPAEFWRLLKPGGEAYIVRSRGEDTPKTFEEELSLRIKLGLPGTAEVEIRKIEPETAKKFHVEGAKMLVIRKPRSIGQK